MALQQSTSCPRESNALSVLSYNVWGIFVAPRIKQRMQAISERLGEYDIVCLQEQFDAADARILFGSAENRAAFPHVHRFESSAVGSGLTIASRYPIVSNYFVPFRLGGKIHRIWEGDAFANKGISVSRVAVPRSKLGGAADDATPVEVLVLNTHLIAPYQSILGEWECERNHGYRLGQVHQLAQLLTALIGDPRVTPFVVCGDFNCGVSTPELQVLHAMLSVQRNLELSEVLRGATTHGPTMDLDHIFFAESALTVRHRCVVQDAGSASSAGECHSDHLGVACSLQLVAASGESATPAPPAKRTVAARAPQRDARGESMTVLRRGAEVLRRQEAAQTRCMFHGTLGAVAILAVAVAAGATLDSTVTGWWPAQVGFVGAGAVAAAMLLVAQVSRRFDAIVFRTAAQDLEALASYA